MNPGERSMEEGSSKVVTSLEERSQQELEALYQTVIDAIDAGEETPNIQRRLMQTGVAETDASELIDDVLTELDHSSEVASSSLSVLAPPIIGGLLAAVATAATWGLLVSLTGCIEQPKPGGKINVVTSFYPLYEFSKRIGGEKAR